jgi:hypothetical protein
VRTPAALTISRGLDTLSVGLDPASLAVTQVTSDKGMRIGAEADAVAFDNSNGAPPPERDARHSRHFVIPGVDLSGLTATWSSQEDGIPAPGTRYAVEVTLVLFETDVAPATAWAPHAGFYKALWTRILRQAEE